MSSQTPTPETTTPVITPATHAAGPDPALNGDEPPCGSAEFGVGGFFPHLDAADPTDPLDETGETR